MTKVVVTLHQTSCLIVIVMFQILLDIEYNIKSVVNMDLPNSYEDHLASLGRDDKSDLGRLNKSIQDSNKKLNNNLQKNFGISIGLTVRKNKRIHWCNSFRNVFTGFYWHACCTWSIFFRQEKQKNIFGVDTFKPSGIRNDSRR